MWINIETRLCCNRRKINKKYFLASIFIGNESRENKYQNGHGWLWTHFISSKMHTIFCLCTIKRGTDGSPKTTFYFYLALRQSFVAYFVKLILLNSRHTCVETEWQIGSYILLSRILIYRSQIQKWQICLYNNMDGYWNIWKVIHLSHLSHLFNLRPIGQN